MAPLYHKCICPVHGYSILGDHVQLVMAYIKGGDLRKFLDTNTLTLETQVRFVFTIFTFFMVFSKSIIRLSLLYFAFCVLFHSFFA